MRRTNVSAEHFRRVFPGNISGGIIFLVCKLPYKILVALISQDTSRAADRSRRIFWEVGFTKQCSWWKTANIASNPPPCSSLNLTVFSVIGWPNIRNSDSEMPNAPTLKPVDIRLAGYRLNESNDHLPSALCVTVSHATSTSGPGVPRNGDGWSKVPLNLTLRIGSAASSTGAWRC